MKYIQVICLILVLSICLLSVPVPAAEDAVCELVVETVTFGADNPDLPLIEDAVNKITEPAIGVRIRLLDVGIQKHAPTIGQMITNGGQLDLITAGLTSPVSSLAADGMLLPLEELLNEYGPDIRELFEDRMRAGYTGDVLYGIPERVNNAIAGGILYNKAMADACGIVMPDPCSMEDLDGIFAQIQEQQPGTCGMAFIKRDVSLMGFVNELENYGNGLYEFGVTFDPWKNTRIENIYESEQYRSFCHKMREWNEKGYIPSNLMTSSVLPNDRLDAGQVFCLCTGYSPMQNAGQLTSPDYGMVRCTEATISTGYVQERMWAIPVTCARPDKAMEFLNLLYTDTELANLLMNGLEGVHYTRVSDHVIAHTDNMGYQRVFTFFGNEQRLDQWLPATEEIISEQKTFEEAALVSLTLGYTFDTRNVEEELEAVDEVISLYAPALECGMLEDVEGALKLFNAALKDAGIDRIIEENVRQLSVWLSEQGH